MKTIRYALVSDGSSDRMLMPILDWLLQRHCPEFAVQPEWADLARLPRLPRTLTEKVESALDLCHPCDLLFIHRDAERENPETRYVEISSALERVATPPVVCVIPVKMQEAWLLFDEVAIRKAAGNPSGRTRLELPALVSVERLPNPKQVLFDLLSQASEFSGTRLKRFKRDQYRTVHLVSKNIDDFSPLFVVPAFQRLEQELLTAIRQQGWYA